MLYGKGAGIYPAASMVIRDLVDVASTIKASAKYMYDSGFILTFYYDCVFASSTDNNLLQLHKYKWQK